MADNNSGGTPPAGPSDSAAASPPPAPAGRAAGNDGGNTPPPEEPLLVVPSTITLIRGQAQVFNVAPKGADAEWSRASGQDKKYGALDQNTGVYVAPARAANWVRMWPSMA